jgi:outer membrane protein assembly factor BamE
MNKKTNKLAMLLIITSFFSLLNCSQSHDTKSNSYMQHKLTSWLHPYKIDVEQGNILKQDNVAALKPGMSKSQVIHLLGTPLLSGNTNKDQWIYIYSNTSNGQLKDRQNLVLSFNEDNLKNITAEKILS